VSRLAAVNLESGTQDQPAKLDDFLERAGGLMF
jgi:hypothetical protein